MKLTTGDDLPDLQTLHSVAVYSSPKMKTGFFENEACISTRETAQHLPSCHYLSLKWPTDKKNVLICIVSMVLNLLCLIVSWTYL